MNDVYLALREHLDTLPAGCPATKSGVEIRILKRLFNPEEASLAVHLRAKLEPATAIAKRAGMTEQEMAPLLEEMTNVDFLIQVSGDMDQHFINKLVKKLNSLEGITLAFPLDPSDLKSRKKLLD